MTNSTKTDNTEIADFDMESASLEIEAIYNNCDETSYLEAVMQWLEKHDIHIDDVNDYLSPALRHKLMNESVNANLIKDTKVTTYDLDSIIM